MRQTTPAACKPAPVLEAPRSPRPLRAGLHRRGCSAGAELPPMAPPTLWAPHCVVPSGARKALTAPAAWRRRPWPAA
eukprot:3846598-Prymnesium_polylepis.1